jgi:hypothetical protein
LYPHRMSSDSHRVAIEEHTIKLIPKGTATK